MFSVFFYFFQSILFLFGKCEKKAERRINPDYSRYERALHCTTKSHRCLHATHAYTGIPCAAYSKLFFFSKQKTFKLYIFHEYICFVCFLLLKVKKRKYKYIQKNIVPFFSLSYTPTLNT